MSKSKPLTDPVLVKAAFLDLAKEITERCELYPGISLNPGFAVSCSVYPSGILGKVQMMVQANTWEGLIEEVRQRWAAHSELHADNITKAMALAIIRITAERGDCTDAALRAEFDGADIIRLGERAVSMANEMAGNGPFEIVPVYGANDQEAA